jgi:hypothetical protein
MTPSKLAKLKTASTCSSGKIQHTDGLSAINHINWLKFSGYPKARPYLCPLCELIHITTK